MRRRKKKGSDIKLLSHTNYVIRENVESYKGTWHDKFGNNNPIHAEFGTGRGKFITTLAKENPNINYIAMEIKEEVLYFRNYCKEYKLWQLFCFIYLQ